MHEEDKTADITSNQINLSSDDQVANSEATQEDVQNLASEEKASGENDNYANKLNKLNLFDILYGVLAHPVETFRYLSANKKWVLGFVIYILVAWIVAIANLPATLSNIDRLIEMKVLQEISRSAATIAIIVFTPIFSAISLFILSGVYHLLAQLFNGKGEYPGLVASLGCANFPRILFIPFALVYYLPNPITFIPSFASFIFSVWVLILEVIAIRETYSLSTSKAILIYLIPIFVVILLVSALIVALGALFYATLSSMS